MKEFVSQRQLMRNSIIVETLWHPVVKENRTLIRLNHVSNLGKVMQCFTTTNTFFLNSFVSPKNTSYKCVLK